MPHFTKLLLAQVEPSTLLTPVRFKPTTLALACGEHTLAYNLQHGEKFPRNVFRNYLDGGGQMVGLNPTRHLSVAKVQRLGLHEDQIINISDYYDSTHTYEDIARQEFNYEVARVTGTNRNHEETEIVNVDVQAYVCLRGGIRNCFE
ncbi:unnamed protein product [Cochlearia groenlandica]